MDFDFEGLTTDELAEMFIDVVSGGFQEDQEFMSALKKEIGTRKDDIMGLVSSRDNYVS